MNIKHIKNIFAIVFFSTLLGILISFPVRQNVEDYEMVDLDSVESLKVEVESIKRENKMLDKAVAEAKEQLSKKETLSKKDDTEMIQSLEEEIEEIQLLSGLKGVEGPGIILTVADNTNKEVLGENVNEDIIHDSDIQIILNDLKRAGAEAISINGERVVSKSEVKCGGPVIKINKKSSANPFVINVIGDSKVLLAAIEGKNTYGDMLKNIYKIRVEAEAKDRIYIPEYNGFENFEYKYAKSKEEGDSN